MPDGFVALDEAGMISTPTRRFSNWCRSGRRALRRESLGRWLWHRAQTSASALQHPAPQERYGCSRRRYAESSERRPKSRFRPSPARTAARSVCCSATSPAGCRPERKRHSAHGAGLHERADRQNAVAKIGQEHCQIVEDHYVQEALELAGGNRTATAEILGLSRQSLYAKLNRYGLEATGRTTRGNLRGVNWRFRPSATPAFGQADLSNCEREQIHLAGSIQPHGVLLVVREPDNVVVQASANAAEFLNRAGRRRARSPSSAAICRSASCPIWSRRAQANADRVRCRIGSPRADFDGLMHRPPGADWSSNSSAPGHRSICPGRWKALEEDRTASSSLRGTVRRSGEGVQDRPATTG